MKKNIILLSLLSFCAFTSACGSDSDKTPGPSDLKSDFEIACENVGGIYQGENRCSCKGVICDEGLVCNMITTSCPSSGISETCDNGQQHCSNSKFYICENYSWTASTDPAITNLCKQNGCLADNSACAECIADSCEDGVFMTCKNGYVIKTENCKSGFCENESKCRDVCQEGAFTCKENQLFECKNNGLVKKQDCPAGCDTSTNDRCAWKCLEGDQICENGGIKTCHSGVYGDQSVPCANNASCMNDTTCGECKNGDKRCVDDGDNGGTVQICVSGQWTEQKACKGAKGQPASCNGNECGECLNDSTTCVEKTIVDLDNVGYIHQCRNGVLSEESEQCINLISGIRFSCNANGQECGECLSGFDLCLNEGSVSNIYHCVSGALGDRIGFCIVPCTPSGSCTKPQYK